MSTTLDIAPAPARRRGTARGPAGGDPRRVRRERLRRALRALSGVLITAGVLLLVDGVLTLTWQEPITAFLARQDQDTLSSALDRMEAAGPTASEIEALGGLESDRSRVAALARAFERRDPHGSAVGRLRIPRLGINFVVVNGSDAGDLEKGPGLYDGSPFPGVPGTTAIAGHRTTYLAPFRHIDELRPGDRIEMQTPYATFTYGVERTRIVSPSDLGVLRAARNEDRLVLSACHPLFSATHRIVVIARLDSFVPVQAARTAPISWWTGVHRFATRLKADRGSLR